MLQMVDYFALASIYAPILFHMMMFCDCDSQLHAINTLSQRESFLLQPQKKENGVRESQWFNRNSAYM